jgi:6-pyruvoyltetrahydropterin/6-carboxytetrahydropterin synthase
MFEIRVEHSFPAGHALRDYVGPCASVHGHNYRVQVCVEAPTLAKNGLLMDFSDLKRALRAACDRVDHKYLNDLPEFSERNTSAENIALFFYEELGKSLREALAAANARIREIVVQETDTAWAVYRPD